MDLLPFDEYARSLNRKRVAAGTLIRDEADRVLVVEPSYKDTWEIPGGACEAGEPPWRAARREQAEELGLDRPPGPLLVVDHVPERGPLPEALAFVFDGGLITEREVNRLVLADPEIRSARLLPIDEAAARANPMLGRRLRVALAAAQAGRTCVFCEAGHPVRA
ncbi:NUDIX domain-containing protein [Amycolatopsis sp. NPDC051903]|uniref:NUDIX domain-containing protein n=1 Tax=Amycolatopsis sp. NPDC051903 TaxID=3363936 RepID=UPI0037994820